MIKISKKQRSTLKEIDKLAGERKRHQIWGFGAIVVMIALIAVYDHAQTVIGCFFGL